MKMEVEQEDVTPLISKAPKLVADKIYFFFCTSLKVKPLAIIYETEKFIRLKKNTIIIIITTSR